MADYNPITRLYTVTEKEWEDHRNPSRKIEQLNEEVVNLKTSIDNLVSCYEERVEERKQAHEMIRKLLDRWHTCPTPLYREACALLDGEAPKEED